EVVRSNLIATNGVIYTLDTVLATPQTINLALAENGSLSRAYEALSAANLADELNGSGPFTLFVPSNEAFDAMGDIPQGKQNMTSLLTYHLMDGETFSWQLQNGTITMLNGQPANVTVEHTDEGTIWRIGNATIVTADIICTNGVIHVIDEVLLPPNMMPSRNGGW
ncbi:MAG TPA: fasciclin domain-containing protein, partial [Methanomassiliicoccaceae archaeon]|nr:fasciclin domain-containing protein [Methanomassiliicoccaceae archaeon]